MRTVLLVAALVALAWPAQANVYICVVLHVYDEEDGELVAAGQEASYKRIWPKIVFDDETGIFKYGREGQWTEERMRVMSKGSDQNTATGYYMHNNTIFSAIWVKAWAKPPSFIWEAGASGDVYTGVCKTYGNL